MIPVILRFGPIADCIRGLMAFGLIAGDVPPARKGRNREIAREGIRDAVANWPIHAADLVAAIFSDSGSLWYGGSFGGMIRDLAGGAPLRNLLPDGRRHVCAGTRPAARGKRGYSCLTT